MKKKENMGTVNTGKPHRRKKDYFVFSINNAFYNHLSHQLCELTFGLLALGIIKL